MASSARIDELLKKFEENPRRYFAPLANEYRKAGDVERAIQLCREHLPQQPGHMSGHIVFGQALFESGQLAEAQEVFQAALALDPENLIALRHLGDIARNAGDVGAARDWYQRVLDADPRNEEIATQLASLASDGAAPAAADPIEPAGDFLAELTLPETAEPAADSAAHDAGQGEDVAAIALPLDAAAPSAQTTGAPADPYATPVGLERPHLLADAEQASAAPEREPETIDLDLSPFDADARGSASAAAEPARGAEGGDAAFPAFDLDSVEATAPPAPAAAFDVTFAEGSADEGDDLERTPAHGAGSLLGHEAPELDASPFGGAAADAEEAELRFLDDPATDDAVPEPAALTPDPVSAAAPPLGLESMEFVPPSRGDADPMAGHLLRDDVGEAATPSAFVTETMAELYLQQGFREEALAVYRQLAAQSPEDENLRDRVAQLESGSRSSVSVAGISDTVIEAARQRQSAPVAPRTARSFFAALALRRPPAPAESAGSDAQDDAPFADAPGSDAPGADAEAQYDDFGFPIAAGRATPTSGIEVAEAQEYAAPTPDDGADLPDSAAIEPATLDYAASGGEDADGSPAEAEPTPSGATAGPAEDAFDLVPPSELAGDRYAAREPEEEDEDTAAESSGPEAATSAEEGPVQSLFGGSRVDRDDDAAASALARAFGAEGPTTGAQGAVRAPGAPPRSSPLTLAPTPPATANATRPAASELSLDHVFRETPRRTPGQRRESPAFSFDQFFSETPNGGAAGRPSSGQRAPATPSSGAPANGDAVDIEQFNAWLEGLKKK